MMCPLCTRTDPHQHDLGVVLNARYYCPDGERHELRAERRWFRRRLRCARCDYVRRP